MSATSLLGDLLERIGGTVVCDEETRPDERAPRVRSDSVEVAPNTVALFSDVVCGWATIALHRFYRERRSLGDPDRLRIDHRPFLLEVVNRAPVPKRVIDSELAVVGTLEPSLGWKPWQNGVETWPVTSLPANEAVRAARRQGAAAAENLDWALRMAFFRDSVCISMDHEIERVARGCRGIDCDRLMDDLRSGAARREMWDDFELHREMVKGSPHFFLPDGSDVHNPGIELHWSGRPGVGFPVVDSDDAGSVRELVAQARGPDPAGAAT